MRDYFRKCQTETERNVTRFLVEGENIDRKVQKLHFTVAVIRIEDDSVFSIGEFVTRREGEDENKQDSMQSYVGRQTWRERCRLC